MSGRVRFLGVGQASAKSNAAENADALENSAPDPAAVRAAYEALFGGVLEVDDLDAWLTALTQRLAVAEAAIEIARRQRAQIVAHMRFTLNRTFVEIAAAQEGLSPQRAGQLAAKGRPHITPLKTER